MSRFRAGGMAAAVLVLGVVAATPVLANGATRTEFVLAQPVVELADPGSILQTGDIRGAVYTGVIESSDPRVAGAIVSTVNVSWIRLGPPTFDYGARMWGTVRIANDGGSWEGTWQGSRGAGWETGVHVINAVTHGHAGYEGLHMTYTMVEWVGTGAILEPGT